jgi:hypothetical protein
LEIKSFCKGKFADFEEVDNLRKLAGRTVVIAGMAVGSVSGVNKKGDGYIRLTVEDYHSKQRDFYLHGETKEKFNRLYTPNALIAISIKPEMFSGRQRFSSDDYRLTVANIDLLENLKIKGFVVELPNGYIDADFTADMEALIHKYPDAKGASVKFRVLDEGMDIILSSGEKVDAKPFCKELRKLMHDDSAIALE